MKKWFYVLTGLVFILGMSCEQSDVNNSDKVSLEYLGEWRVKGSWTSDWDECRFIKEETNDSLGWYIVSDLYDKPYDFVIMKASGDANSLKLPAATADVSVGSTAVEFNDPSGKNAQFKPTKKAVKIKIDINNPAKPLVSVHSEGTENVMPIDFAALASKLRIKGDIFTIGWTETDGIADAATKTVTFDNLKAAKKTGGFGFSSMDGFLKDLTIASPVNAGDSSGPHILKTSGGNCTITGIPNSDSAYTLKIVIDETKEVDGGRYAMTLTLKDKGSTAWASAVPAKFYLTGANLEGINWNWDDATKYLSTAVGADTAVFTAKATGTDVQVKFNTNPVTGWGSALGFGDVRVDGSPIALSDVGGNIKFTAEVGKQYTIRVSFDADYVANGKPLVSVKQE